MATLSKKDMLQRIQAHVNEWDSLDKELLLMELIEDHLNDDEIYQLMMDQNIPIVDGLKR